MISFVVSHDIIITSFYWDLLGLISYLPINFWSSKINCGIKAVLYNKIGDNFSLFLLILFYSFLSFSSSFGGFTGLISANSIIDTILHDSYFIIGHLHYVLSLGAIYTISAAFWIKRL